MLCEWHRTVKSLQQATSCRQQSKQIMCFKSRNFMHKKHRMSPPSGFDPSNSALSASQKKCGMSCLAANVLFTMDSHGGSVLNKLSIHPVWGKGILHNSLSWDTSHSSYVAWFSWVEEKHWGNKSSPLMEQLFMDECALASLGWVITLNSSSWVY